MTPCFGTPVITRACVSGATTLRGRPRIKKHGGSEEKMIAAADRLIEIGIVLTKLVSMPIMLVVLFAVICKLAKDGRG